MSNETKMLQHAYNYHKIIITKHNRHDFDCLHGTANARQMKKKMAETDSRRYATWSCDNYRFKQRENEENTHYLTT